jgi:ferric-dicitrate binding protein FerR (iron transport regulator)
MAPAKRVIPLTARTWLKITAAAAVLAVIATGIVLYRHTTDNNTQLAAVPLPTGYDSLANNTTNTQQLLLADSTRITLQPGAVVYYPPAFSGATRELYLYGSAFFNVYHDPKKHFKVHMKGGLTTEVLGTSFHITQNKRDPNIEVAVVTGKVLVYKQDNTEQDTTGSVVLTRNKKVTFNAISNRLITGIVSDPQPLPKTTAQPRTSSQQPRDQFVFEEASLQEVLQSLSDAYGIMIVPENEGLSRYHFTGDLSKYSLFTQLEYICKSTQTTYEINGSQIIVKENQH